MGKSIKPTIPPIEESNLFIASRIDSLDDFLKTDIAKGKHIYCSFQKEHIDIRLWALLSQKQVQSIRFNNGEISVLQK
ncbi:protein of unknown function (plasmid) [Vibrio harveyi]|uniref:hypothetical protein n=1 Tax=Vibrio harveyi TaxID=669 RepID=UPI000302DCCC|nr:hypothetical protein [Vibrio harveyi]ELY1990157.1 hypothetical protein [Vibrio harveyi]MCG9237427.1 hypothetical protein [Vibrio harveyi]MCG9612836.1 hypothetical protein [Vibrio harveyi]MCG9671313.1 hypothetical protein [Vibrio harveyi]CAH1237645.1 protein of unknown function [Vibrio harveyi]